MFSPHRHQKTPQELVRERQKRMRAAFGLGALAAGAAAGAAPAIVRAAPPTTATRQGWAEETQADMLAALQSQSGAPAGRHAGAKIINNLEPPATVQTLPRDAVPPITMEGAPAAFVPEPSPAPRVVVRREEPAGQPAVSAPSDLPSPSITLIRDAPEPGGGGDFKPTGPAAVPPITMEDPSVASVPEPSPAPRVVVRREEPAGQPAVSAPSDLPNPSTTLVKDGDYDEDGRVYSSAAAAWVIPEPGATRIIDGRTYTYVPGEGGNLGTWVKVPQDGDYDEDGRVYSSAAAAWVIPEPGATRIINGDTYIYVPGENGSLGTWVKDAITNGYYHISPAPEDSGYDAQVTYNGATIPLSLAGTVGSYNIYTSPDGTAFLVDANGTIVASGGGVTMEILARGLTQSASDPAQQPSGGQIGPRGNRLGPGNSTGANTGNPSEPPNSANPNPNILPSGTVIFRGQTANGPLIIVSNGNGTYTWTITNGTTGQTSNGTYTPTGSAAGEVLTSFMDPNGNTITIYKDGTIVSYEKLPDGTYLPKYSTHGTVASSTDNRPSNVPANAEPFGNGWMTSQTTRNPDGSQTTTVTLYGPQGQQIVIVNGQVVDQSGNPMNAANMGIVLPGGGPRGNGPYGNMDALGRPLGAQSNGTYIWGYDSNGQPIVSPYYNVYPTAQPRTK